MPQICPHSASALAAVACLMLGAGSAPLQAQTLRNLSVEPRMATVGEPVAIKLELAPDRGDPWCGITIDFGNNDVREIRIGENGVQDLTQVFSLAFRQPGIYAVSVQGKFLRRGLKSVTACAGRLSAATILVSEAAPAAAATSTKP